MPEFYCRLCNLKVPSKTCQSCKSDKYTYEVKVLRTSEEADELIRNRDKRNGFNEQDNTNIQWTDLQALLQIHLKN